MDDYKVIGAKSESKGKREYRRDPVDWMTRVIFPLRYYCWCTVMTIVLRNYYYCCCRCCLLLWCGPLAFGDTAAAQKFSVVVVAVVAVGAPGVLRCLIAATAACSPGGIVVRSSALPLPCHPQPPPISTFAFSAPSARICIFSPRLYGFVCPFCRYIDLKFSAPTQGLLQVNT